MGAHYAKPKQRLGAGRRRQLGALSMALGVALLAFAFVDEDGTPVDTPPTATSAPTVLGIVVDREDPTTTEREPEPAVPATFDAEGETSPTTVREAGPTTTGRPAATTTTEGAVLIPPTVVTNTTTTRPPRPITTTTTSTTTAPTTTEAPPTTEPAGT